MDIQEISSLQHPLVKHCVKLREDRSYRQNHGSVIVSGTKLLGELAGRSALKVLFIQQSAEGLPAPAAQKQVVVTASILKKITGLQHPEPFAAEVTIPPQADLCCVRSLLILDGLADPGNLGTLLRSAWALGWKGVFITEQSVDPWNEKALRAAKGATFLVPWYRGSHEELIHVLEAIPRTLYIADAQGEDFQSMRFCSPLALALGNEARGVSSALKAQGKTIGIPMNRDAESLNVASAGAILLQQMRP